MEQENSEIVVEQEIVYSDPTLRPKLVRTGLLLILFILLVLTMVLSDKLKRVMRRVDPGQTSVLAQIVNMIPELVPTPEPTAEPTPTTIVPIENYVLRRTNGESVATISASINDRIFLALWENLLLYPDKSATEGAVIQAKNIETGAVQTIFHEVESVDQSEIGQRDITSFELIEDSLLFSITGNMMEGAQFRLKLDSPQQAYRIASIQNGNFVADWHNRSWILGGNIEACGGNDLIYKIDPNTWKVALVADIDADCENGQKIIGIDYKDRILIGGYTTTHQYILEPMRKYYLRHFSVHRKSRADRRDHCCSKYAFINQ